MAFRIPCAVFQVPKSRIQDSTSKKFPGFRNSSHVIGDEEMAGVREGGGYDVAMNAVVKEGQTLTIQKCDFNIEMFYFIVNRNRNACFKK